MSKINWKNKCWVTTIFLVHNDKVLLNWNKVLQTWIPIGGHIDRGETPQEAVMREVKEEVGFDFDFYGDSSIENNGQVEVIKLHRFQIEKVPHHKQHMNFIFFGKCKNPDIKVKETDEKEKLRWFNKKELLGDSVMLESVRKSSLRALKLIRD